MSISGPVWAKAASAVIILGGSALLAPLANAQIEEVVVTAERRAESLQDVSVSVTAFETSSNAFNVIPPSVRLRGTVRTLSQETQDLAEARLKSIVQLTAEAMGATADVAYKRNYPVMVNSESGTGHAEEAAVRVAGECGVAPLVMGGEDFAFMLDARPGAYILVGNGDTAPVHHPEYDFNDAAIPAGCSWFVEVAEGRLPLSE